MFTSYLKIALRNLRKHKGYSTINIAGLSMGMAVCILIFLWVQDEWSFDRFHAKANRIFRVVSEYPHSSGEIRKSAVTSWPLGAALKENYPEIASYTRFYNLSRRLMTCTSGTGDRRFYENGVCVADPSFLDIFSFPFVKGDPSGALTEPGSVVITEDIAEKYFGDENPIGKVFMSNNRIELMVTGVVRVPRNSHLRFDFLVPFEWRLKNTSWEGNWWINDFHTFVLLDENVSREQLETKIHPYISNRFAEYNVSTKLRLQPLLDLHLRSDYNYDMYGASRDTSVYIYAFSVIAVFILFIACINFINLTIAMSSTRAREAGLRRAAGAGRKNILAQFFGESVFLTLIAFFWALAVIALFLPYFNDLTGKSMILDPLGHPGQGLCMLLVALLAGIAAGIYPAVIQSSCRAIHLLKGDAIFRGGKTGRRFRNALVVLQFTCSILLIVGTRVIHRQFVYIRNKNLGYAKEQIVAFTRRGELRDRYDAFKEALLQYPGIISVTTSSDIPTRTHHSTMRSFEWEGMQPDANRFSLYHFSVDYDYIDTFGLRLAEGRNFSRSMGTDGAAYILNQSAVKTMDLADPVGTGFTFWRNAGTIIGVVEDYHFQSLHSEVEPMVLRIDPDKDRYVFVKIRSGHIPGTLEIIEGVHRRFEAQYPLEYHFLDERLDRLYDHEKRTFQLFRCFSILAVFISCMGLFGLAAYMARRRTKEIGIRKVVGGTIPGITMMLSKEFLILVGIANLVAWPIAYYTMHGWLENFAYRTNIGIGIFLFSGVLAVSIALITVGFQSVKAARANPVESLRYE